MPKLNFDALKVLL